MKLIGFNYPPGVGGWHPDVVGMLIEETQKGWVVVDSHISSSTGWARIDIGNKADRATEGMPADLFSYEWVGEKTRAEIMAMCPPAPEDVDDAAESAPAV